MHFERVMEGLGVVGNGRGIYPQWVVSHETEVENMARGQGV